METIEDYISLVASGMGITLNKKQTETIAQEDCLVRYLNKNMG